MSRTDVHRPYWVQMQDPTIRHWFRDFHHHESGICDLDHFLATVQGWWYRASYHCYRQQWCEAPNLCNCHLCTGAPGRRLKRRRERVHWRKVRRELLKTQAADREDVDVPIFYAESW